jgi:release factor glutamine methyltransferase
MIVAEASRLGARSLAAAGVPAPEWDAEALLRHVLGWERATLVARSGEALAPESATRFFALVEERARRRPLQHLIGIQPFWRQELLVSPDVLIPRPETELVVEASLDVLRGVPRPVVVDVGTGSGAIALALAAELPAAELHAVDVSAPALAVARENARRLGLEERIAFHEGDLLAPLAELSGRVDLVASNPPYVDPNETLLPEVRDHEPALALFPPGERDSVYRRLAPQAFEALRPGGFLIVEVGFGMSEGVAAILGEAGFDVQCVLRDLQQIPRTVVARRR